VTEKPGKAHNLSSREHQIAQDYAQGENYQQIANRLCLAPVLSEKLDDFGTDP